MCFDSTRNLAIFKVKILENQKILEEIEEEEILETEDFTQEEANNAVLKSESRLKLCDFKIEQQSDEEAKVTVKVDFYEEYLEEELECFNNSTPRKDRESIDQYDDLEMESFDRTSVKRKAEKKRLCAGESRKKFEVNVF